MTAKRFIIKNERTVCDGFYGKCFVCSWKSDAEEVCGLLNELHEENMLLKKYRNAIWNCNSSKIIRVNENTGEVDLIDKELKE